MIILPLQPQSRFRLDFKGFTLIELLVVITIIVILISMLAPALDKAVYQSQLVQCSGQLHSLAVGGLSYASSSKRYYISRYTLQYNLGYGEPRVIQHPLKDIGRDSPTPPVGQLVFDDRTKIASFTSAKTLQCPLSPKLDMEVQDVTKRIYGSYMLFMGWQYKYDSDGASSPGHGMFKMGDKLGHFGRQFGVLAGDHDSFEFFVNTNAHPDDRGVLPEHKPSMTETDVYFHDWAASLLEVGFPGKYDMNYAYDDGSVIRIAQMHFDPRAGAPMDALPKYRDSTWVPTDPSSPIIAVPRGK